MTEIIKYILNYKDKIKIVTNGMILQENYSNVHHISSSAQENNVVKDGLIIWILIKKGNYE